MPGLIKNQRKIIIILLVFIASVVFIAGSRSFHFFLPSQQVELSHGVEYGAVIKGFLFVQEITMQNRYISRVDLYMAKLPSQLVNENVFLLLDENQHVLYTRRFLSSEIGEALFFSFDFHQSFDIGRGKKVFACIYSIDGEQQSYIGLAKKEDSRLGKLYVVSIVNNDILLSLEKQTSRVDFKGSIGVRTFESDSKFFSFFQLVMYLFALVIALLLYFSRKIMHHLSTVRIKPEMAYLGISLFFGLTIVVVNPPFQVPDEPTHFLRSYQVAGMNFFRSENDIPSSLINLAAISDRMKFSTHEKTTPGEILSMADIRLAPEVRSPLEPSNFIVPYIPQALGIVMGKILHLNPLWLFYLGRIFNLLVSVFLVFMAIRITPVNKWLLFLLGVMPMTLYQFASLSYDAFTISLSFLLTSMFLNHALNAEKRISFRQILLLLLLSGLLASSKPPYLLVAFMFLIIPVSKIGSPKRYALTFATLLLTLLFAYELSVPVPNFFAKFFTSSSIIQESPSSFPADEPFQQNVRFVQKPFLAMLPLLPHDPQEMQSAADQPDSGPGAAPPANPPSQSNDSITIAGTPVNPLDPLAQKQFILDDPVRYFGIMFHTLQKSFGLYMVSYVGLFGWVDTPIPDFLAYAYLIVLLIVSLAFPVKGIRISLMTKLILLALFLAVYALVETAMYLYCNPVGADPIIAVQGRYFIAIGPVWFLLFYNHWVRLRIINIMPGMKNPVGKPAQRMKKKNTATPSTESPYSIGMLPWFSVIFGALTLIYSLYVIIERFYVITI